MKNEIPKKPREEAMSIMFEELKGMLPTVLICNGIVLLVCVVYTIATDSFSGSWRLLTGLLFGNAAILANFYALGAKSARIIRRKESGYARTYTTTMFFVRYIGAFAVFGALVTFNIINMYTVVVPLFYPKIHYTIKAVFNKEV